MNPRQETLILENIKDSFKTWFQAGRAYESNTDPFALDNNAMDFAAEELLSYVKQVLEIEKCDSS